MQKPILIVDDDPDVVELIRLYCHKNSFYTRSAATAEEAFAVMSECRPQLLLLDLSLPDMDGLYICQEVRKTSSVPIIILTARGEESDRILGLELGADDYIAKPFSPRELIARMKAVLRRCGSENNDEGLLRFGPLTINSRQRTVTIDGEEVRLTQREFDLLEFMAQSPGQAFHREQLMNAVWGIDFYGDLRNVDTHIKNIRQKLKGLNCIESVWGIGYRFLAIEEEASVQRS